MTKLLRLGVGGAFVLLSEPFHLGGIGTYEHEQPYDIESPLLAFSHAQPFNLGSRMLISNDQPFDIEGPQVWRLVEPFDIIASGLTSTSAPAPTIGAIAGSSAQPSSLGSTTTTAPVGAGAQQVVVASVADLAVGRSATVGDEARVITAIGGLTLTLDRPLVRPHATGTLIVAYPGGTTSASSLAGATTLTFASLPAGFIRGMHVSITSSPAEQRVVTDLTGTTVTLSAPLALAHPAGTFVSASIPGFIDRAIMVFDKAGHRVGDITKFTITEPRSRAIGYAGQMALYVPRTHPDAALILDDCLVAVASSIGLEMWAGTLGRQRWTQSKGAVNVPDAFDLWSDVPIAFSEAEQEVPDNTPASNIYNLVVSKLNDVKSAHNEILWGVDANGTKVFRGDLPEKANAWQALQLVAARSQTEFRWRADMMGNDLMLTLVARDSFDEPVGIDFTDGPGGNIASDPSYTRDPAQRIRAIRLRGTSTDITRYLPDWAHWAAHDVTPEVSVSLPEPLTPGPGDPRYRERLEVNVDWTLSKKEQRRLAKLTEDKLWVLYYSFLYAWHDMRGMTFHDKWLYEGPPENLEGELNLRNGWHTYQVMAKYKTDTSAHVVMRNLTTREYLVAIYYLSQELKVVYKVSMDEVYSYPLPYASLTGTPTINIYSVNNKVASLFATYVWTAGDEWLLYSPIVVTYNDQPITLRGIVDGPFRGRYVNLAEEDWSLRFRDPYGALFDIGGLISYIWPWEYDRVRLWDPRRDGVGEQLSTPTVFGGEMTTDQRWHIVPYSLGEYVETSLEEGVYHWDTILYVTTVDGWPTTYPFNIRVDPDTSQVEDMVVVSGVGGQWEVLRGISLLTSFAANVTAGDTIFTVSVAPDPTIVNGRVVLIDGIGYVVAEATGTTIRLASAGGLANSYSSGEPVQFTGQAQLHETGARVQLIGGTAFDGFEFPYNWPEGQMYAQDLLDRSAGIEAVLTMQVVNRDDGWASIKEGSVHDAALTLEGPFEGVTDTVRVIGYAPDEDSGRMEVIVEKQVT